MFLNHVRDFRVVMIIWFFFVAIWLMPAYNTYGTWPASGEIDLVESRGNRDMTFNGVNIGAQVRYASTLSAFNLNSPSPKIV